eukprot:TRINITY_DN17361_c0_g1_i1.p1 TRINITY_DN17361_c0_g1~~TRINITY_DN17361_c0_g1_i1.p1  ORF type:complete len:423 (+),score=67.27 TRINITY_DN17361_c0_g1_i1:52-1320(+)
MASEALSAGILPPIYGTSCGYMKMAVRSPGLGDRAEGPHRLPLVSKWTQQAQWMQMHPGSALSMGTAVVLAAALTHGSVRRRRCRISPGLDAAGALTHRSVRRRHIGISPGLDAAGLVGLKAVNVEIMPAESSTVARKDKSLGCFLPPEDVRTRIKLTRGWLGKTVLAFVGDTVWEYLVLRHQYMQGVRSALTENQIDRATKQARAAIMLYRQKGCLTRYERTVIRDGTSRTWRKKVATNRKLIQAIGVEMYSAALGLRTLLGWLYLDAESSDRRLEEVAEKLGLMVEEGLEDKLLAQVTNGTYNPAIRQSGTYFLALAPLGHACLRMYIIRYLSERPLRDDEFVYRVRLALRQEELDVASLGFLKDDATEEEARLVKNARDAGDSYAFAFECLLGHLALTAPYRLHQIIAGFGFARPLPGT